MCPRAKTSLDYEVRVDIVVNNGKPAARIVSMRRVKSD
jgi:hypothetical protein